MNDTITREDIARYADALREQERSENTVKKYVHDLQLLHSFLGGAPLTKSAVIAWKQQLSETRCASTVNSMLAAANGYFLFIGRSELRVRRLKMQRALFLEEERELTRGEYAQLVQTASALGKERLALVLQTVCATGIRISELRFITAEAVALGRAEICCKGKRRTVFLPRRLCQLLRQYLQKEKKTAGAVFTTRTGRPLDRSNIWREMRALCQSAQVSPQKVFPHNLRHLFARSYYAQEHDLGRLADLLGHSNIATTRIYTAESGATHSLQLERLGLVTT